MTSRRSEDGVPFLDLRAMNDEVADDVDAAWQEVLSNTTFIGGPAVERFEEAWARYCGTRFAVGVGNGTDALALALRALDIGLGAEVILPANTFVATVEAVVAAGATPRFVDVDPATLLMSATAVEAAVTPDTAAVIVVHLYGQVSDMDALARVADRAGIVLLEDAAQAHGATWRSKKAGSLGRAGCFSFYPGKNLGAYGDAGAIVTDDRDLAERVRSLADHGRAPSSKHLHPLAGINSRLDALQGAVLTAKLARLDGWNAARREAVRAYRDRLQGAGVRLLRGIAGGIGAHHLEVVRVPRRDEVRAALARDGVQTALHYPVPCHKQEPYERFSFAPLPVVEQAAKEILSLPLFPHITGAQIEQVSNSLESAVRQDARAHAS